MYHIMSFMSPGFGGVQVHLRVRSYCLDPHEQQPLHAGHQGGGGGGGDDGGGDGDHDEHSLLNVLIINIIKTFVER